MAMTWVSLGGRRSIIFSAGLARARRFGWPLLLGLTVAARSTPPDGPAGAVTYQVLELDGKDACVELPPNLFTNEVVTLEGWVKWRSFGD